MRPTLEQLKGMSSQEISKRWAWSKFPFDGGTGCHHCITSHAVPGACRVKEHEQFRQRSEELWYKIQTTGRGSLGNSLLINIEEFYALRLYFDAPYQAEIVEQPAETPLDVQLAETVEIAAT